MNAHVRCWMDTQVGRNIYLRFLTAWKKTDPRTDYIDMLKNLIDEIRISNAEDSLGLVPLPLLSDTIFSFSKGTNEYIFGSYMIQEALNRPIPMGSHDDKADFVKIILQWRGPHEERIHLEPKHLSEKCVKELILRPDDMPNPILDVLVNEGGIADATFRDFYVSKRWVTRKQWDDAVGRSLRWSEPRAAWMSAFARVPSKIVSFNKAKTSSSADTSDDEYGGVYEQSRVPKRAPSKRFGGRDMLMRTKFYISTA